jgi:hypothetical protein
MNDSPMPAPATDDQELAKVLESMNTTLSAAPVAAGLTPAQTAPANITPASTVAPTPVSIDPITPVATPAPVVSPMKPTNSGGDLEAIKKDAVSELRPLVDKLNLGPQDKFDTILLIIRSTDDRSLISQAHDAAKMIQDESKRAEALLDVIKEIDYFSQPAA